MSGMAKCQRQSGDQNGARDRLKGPNAPDDQPWLANMKNLPVDQDERDND